ncbi:hypothetical protein HO133_008161 [Letharia lupina]|uniref:Uncharacterized protein n=1 Tax=Letharia lupina TaxID=560253 RepID=A0A8H6CSA6_9LECA|nr:uncharacterized protein HO133_008161 [Letharia lupina]KAF6228431.1 hypothetical protein HO133_008161 [Letharia lupina]
MFDDAPPVMLNEKDFYETVRVIFGNLKIMAHHLLAVEKFPSTNPLSAFLKKNGQRIPRNRAVTDLELARRYLSEKAVQTLVLLVSKDAIALPPLSLIQPPSEIAQLNSTLSPNMTYSHGPKDPLRLVNQFVQPPIAVIFQGYGDSISRGLADVCLYKALDYALSTRDHPMLAPIDVSDLDYTSANVALNFHPDKVVIWEEWKNALYLMLEFVDEYDTREFFFALEIDGGTRRDDWDVVDPQSFTFLVIPPQHFEHDYIFLSGYTTLVTFAVIAMTPPLTGFFMRVAGLGDVHKEIERRKRVVRRVEKSGPRDQNPLDGQVGQSYRTSSPSRSVRDDQQITKGPRSSVRETVRSTDGPPPLPRVHWKDLSRDTLAEYNLAWTWDNNDKDYIIIQEHLTWRELDLLLQHTGWLRERKELNLALRESKKEVEQMQKLCESKAPKDRSDVGRKSEKRCECDAERASARDDQNLDGGHAHVSQPGIHIHVNQTQNNQPPAPQEASTAQTIPELPSPSHRSSQCSMVPAMHSKLTRPWSPHDYTSMERPRQPPRQTHRSRSRSRASQAPDELPSPTKKHLAPEQPADSGGTYRHHRSMSTLHPHLVLRAWLVKNAGDKQPRT